MADASDLEYARSLSGIRALMNRDLEEYFEGLPFGDPERARNELLEFVPRLVAEYGESAAGHAADWYDEQRFQAGVPGRFRAALQVSPYQAGVEPSVRRVAGELFDGDPSETLTGLQSFAPKYALAAARQTVQTNSFADPASGGWRRVANGPTCKFCIMLVGRGAVYRRDSAFFASHGSCDCAAVPSFDPSAPEVEVDVYAVSRRTTMMTAAQKARHNEAVRMAILRHVDGL